MAMNKPVPHYKYHPAADAFPMMGEKAHDEFTADIGKNGLRDKILLDDDMILDGRNRHRALLKLGKCTPECFETFEDYCARTGTKFDPIAFVVSKNIHRRHLTTRERAFAAARLADLKQGQRKSANLQLSDTPTQKEAAEMLNVSPRSVASVKKVLNDGADETIEALEKGSVAVDVAESFAQLSKEEQAAIIQQSADPKAVNKVVADLRAEKTAKKKLARAEKERALAGKAMALPDGKFQVILTDDEWQFEPYSRETGMDRAADNHYPTSGIEALEQRDVASLAADDCVLFMWATAPMLPQAISLMGKRGFTYKSHVMWFKEGRKGTGYWFRNCHEILLVGTRGKIPAPAMGEQWDSVVKAPVGKHSQKPDIFYELIEGYFPNAKKIELNARRARKGWFAWGNEAPENAPEAEPENLPVAAPSMYKLAAAKALLAGSNDDQDVMYRPTPQGQPTLDDVLSKGDLIEVVRNGGEPEQFRILLLNGPYETPCGAEFFTLAVIVAKKYKPDAKRDQTPTDFLRELVARDGKIVPLNVHADVTVTKLEVDA